MSEYPELEGYEAGADFSSKDLAARERELLGEAGAAELVGSSGDAEVSDAEPEPHVDIENRDVAEALDHAESGAPASGESSSFGAESAEKSSAPSTFVPGAGPSAYVPKKVDLRDSAFLKDWKAKSDEKLEQKDKASAEKRESTREKARKQVDDFYENYNAKKEKEAEQVHEDAKEFSEKRDKAIGSGEGTTWDRINKLMDGLGRPAEGVAPADKKRFAELVQSLKGDANAPGAAGY